MANYAWMYRLGITPWERYGAAGGAQLGTLLDREADERSPGSGRAFLLTEPDGTSHISAEDLSVAALDEIENPDGDRHFTVAHNPVGRTAT
ncbi:hypothetical protein F4561_005667 [Lipingzhangella halophila]|uniref:Uncharacterized protein n=1 Tax=Lipingzhangella halophila TaxID=1783352 RepID=A0A7W7RMK7_9ACTN|nr:hypothetical protein [Lipingzhangella halophila]